MPYGENPLKGIIMQKNDLELIVVGSAVTICVLGYKLHKKNRQLKSLSYASRKLIEWTNIAQRVMTETWESHPELISELSTELTTDIQFYSIMAKENLV